jgi:hypothetical protein
MRKLSSSAWRTRGGSLGLSQVLSPSSKGSNSGGMVKVRGDQTV